jgi:hypothetical protein
MRWFEDWSAHCPQGAATGTAGGVKVTASVQDPAAGTPPVQLVFSTAVKLPGGFTLGMPTLRIAGAVPVLVIVTVTGGDAVPASVFPKAIGEGETVAAACSAVPFRATISVLCIALSEIGNKAERLPDCVGSKTTVITHDLPAATEPPKQLSDS